MTRLYTNYFNLCGSEKLTCNNCKVIIIMNSQVIYEYRQNSTYPLHTQDNMFWCLEPVNVPSHSHDHVLLYSTANLKIRKLSYTPHLFMWEFENSNFFSWHWQEKSKRFKPGKGSNMLLLIWNWRWSLEDAKEDIWLTSIKR